MTPKNHQKRIMIIAGEASGDMHGAHLAQAIQKKDPSIFFFGIGGNALKKAGVQVHLDSSELSVVGITEVFSRAPAILRGASVAKKLLRDLKPDLLVLIDFPEFNLHIAGYAKKLGLTVLYYISPQIWAWRSGRVRKIKQRVDHMAVILPFEATFYRKYKIPVTFVGHPLLDTRSISPLHRKEDQPEQTIGILPGSRIGEVSRHLPDMLEAAHLMTKQNNKLKFVVSLAPSIDKKWVEEMINSHEGPASFEMEPGGIDKVFKRSTMIIAVSGTVTLEATIAGIPMVIVYKVSFVSSIFAKLLIHIKHIGLANLIADESIVPELIQEEVTPENISKLALEMIIDPDRLGMIRKKLLGIRKALGGPGVSERTADIALNLIHQKSS